MMSILRPFTLCLALSLTACMPESQVTAEPTNQKPSSPLDAPQTACDAAKWSSLVGQPAAAADVIPGPKRLIRPGMAITMDHRLDRTNIDLDSSGNISRIWCG